jgi:uncharacterized repeat protein (TIGR03803 family)
MTLCSFSGTNGLGPVGELVQGGDDNFYGTTMQGATNYSQSNPGHGTVFRVTPGGELTSLAVFQGSNGANPNAGLALGSDGNFYGCTSAGGDLDEGVVFQITPGGTLTRVYSMSSTSGSLPYSRFVQGSDGRFYGTTAAGGPMGSGNIFRLGLPLAATQVIRANDHDVLIGWNAVIGQTYQIQCTLASPSRSWTNLGGLIAATNSSMIIKDQIAYGSIGKLYRVVSSY